MTETKVYLLKMMNQYIIDLGDKDIWMDWIALGIPDEPQEDDYLFFAENDDQWVYICDLFSKLVNGEEN